MNKVIAAGSLGLVLTLQPAAADELCCVIYQPTDKVLGHGVVYYIPKTYFGSTMTNENIHSYNSTKIYLIE